MSWCRRKPPIASPTLAGQVTIMAQERPRLQRLPLQARPEAFQEWLQLSSSTRLQDL
jgi:hypothetical protein